jgi:Family of unknown function (DUF5681)
LKNLRSWKKGQSGNPGGRPKRLITDAYEAQLIQPVKGDNQKRTYAELIAAAQIRKALRGNTMAAKEVTDRIEGKTRQAADVGLAPLPDLNLRVRFVKSCAQCAGKRLKHCPNCGDKEI